MNKKKLKHALIIPTWNASQYIDKLFASIAMQTLIPEIIFIIDSSSTDETQTKLRNHPVTIHTIPKNEFDHGKTRQLATQLIDADVYIFMSQDALLSSKNSLQNLYDALMSSSDIACAYGRQLPSDIATPLSAHLRYFNYPEMSSIKSIADIARYGIKTCFNSDSFSAYKQSALQSIGGFPTTSMGEDTIVAAKLLLNNFKIYYVAQALVYHSHNFNLAQEFRRYFSIGLFHKRENWIIDRFKAPTGEGIRYIQSEVRYLFQNKKWHWLPYAVCTWAAKFLGYRLGWHEKYLSEWMKSHLKY